MHLPPAKTEPPVGAEYCSILQLWCCKLIRVPTSCQIPLSMASAEPHKSGPRTNDLSPPKIRSGTSAHAANVRPHAAPFAIRQSVPVELQFIVKFVLAKRPPGHSVACCGIVSRSACHCVEANFRCVAHMRGRRCDPTSTRPGRYEIVPSRPRLLTPAGLITQVDLALSDSAVPGCQVRWRLCSLLCRRPLPDVWLLGFAFDRIDGKVLLEGKGLKGGGNERHLHGVEARRPLRCIGAHAYLSKCDDGHPSAYGLSHTHVAAASRRDLGPARAAQTRQGVPAVKFCAADGSTSVQNIR